MAPAEFHASAEGGRPSPRAGAARRLLRAFALTRRFVAKGANVGIAIAIFGLALIGLIWILAAVHAEVERQQAIANAVRNDTNLVKAFEGYTVRTLKSVDAGLLVLRREYARLGKETDVARYLASGFVDNDLFITIYIADEHGNVVLGSEPVHPASVAATAEFQAQREHNSGPPYIGQPVQNPFSLTWSIPVSRRIVKNDGSFGGAVIGMVDPSYFTGFYREANLGARGVVVLVGVDGISRVRQSGISTSFGTDMSHTDMFKAQGKIADGDLLTSGTLEGIPRFISYRTLRDYPLFVAVGSARDDVLADANEEQRVAYGVAGLVSVAIALFTGLLIASLDRQRRALRALGLSETRFRATFNEADIGIAHYQLDGRFLQVNPKLCAVLGYSPDELLAMNVHELVYAQNYYNVNAVRQQLLSGVISSHTAERRLIRKDGNLIWALRKVSVVRDASGEPQYFVLVLEDITDRRNSEQRFFATFEQAAVGIAHIAIDDRRHLLVNQKLCDMLGYTREELMALRAEDVIHAEDTAPSQSARARLLSGEIKKSNSEARYICKDGRVIWVGRTMSVARDDDGNPLYFIRVSQDISARKEAEQQFRATYDQDAVGIAHISPDGRYLRANTHFCNMLGYDEAELMRLHFRDITHPEDLGEGLELQRHLYAGEIDSGSLEKRYLHKNGSLVWANMSLALVKGADGQAKYHIAVVTDISGRKAQEQKIARLNRTRAVLGGINALIVRVRDRDTLFREACKIAVDIGNFGVAWIGLLDPETLTVTPVASAGLSLEELVVEPRSARPEVPAGQGVVGRAIRERRPVFDNDISRNLEIGGGRRKLATELGYRSLIALPLSMHDRVVGNLSLYSTEESYFNEDEIKLLNQLAGDISFALEHIDQAEKLNHLAYYDALTGLPNRVLFQDLLKQALAQTRRNQGVAGVLFLDLDGFKVINDTLGHVVGDQLLTLAAGRLLECVREVDIVARFGGDEFAVMLTELAAAQDASLVAQKILEAFASPFELDGNETYVSASIGIALYPLDSDNVDALIKNADAAMYGAKAAGRNNFQFYTAEMNSNASKKMQLGTSLRRALERNEFVLHYQPKIDLIGGRIVGFEALLRWQPPEGPLVQPGEFIPLLEETGLIVQVGEWALRAACRQIKEWESMDIEPVPLAINLSGRQFEQAGLDAVIRGILAEAGVEPRWIQLEITESMLMRSPEAAIPVLENLKALGIHISVDDFGTGYSSLSYLKRFPLDALKVDRSFVQDIPNDADDTAIARAVITMAHSLNLKVIAEGVETRDQVKFLRHNRCDEGQGYLFAKPLPAHECTTWLAGSRRSEKIVPAGEQVTVPAVLLVDDDPDCLTLTRYLLAPDGYRILMAANATEALELLALEDVSVIVSDENMPGMRGVELLSRVKTMYPHVARIMMTGETDFHTAAKAINEGEVFKFFVKQRDDHLLRHEVRRAFWSRDGLRDYQPLAGEIPREQDAQVANVVRMLRRSA